MKVKGPTEKSRVSKARVYGEIAEEPRVLIMNQSGSKRKTWKEWFDRLKAFKDRFGHCDVNSAGKKYRPLAQWAAGQRLWRRKGWLMAQQIRMLDGLGFHWDAGKRRADENWMKHYRALVEYTRLHGNPHVPNAYHDLTLARWVTRQRSRRRGTFPGSPPLSTQQVKLLDKLGFSWDGNEVTAQHTGLKADQRWMERYRALVRYATRHGGSTCVPSSYHDRSLVIWIRVQRRRRRGPDAHAGRTLSTQQIKLLDKLGFCWDAHEDRWDRKFEELREFIARHGHARVPWQCNGRRSALAEWVRRQRRLKRKRMLSPSRRRKWEQLDPAWR